MADTSDDMAVPEGTSPLDAKTHAEMCMLYAESTETLRFVKTHQWKTVGATLLTFLGLIFIAGFVEADQGFADKLLGISILLTCAVIFTLIIYQFWMHNEARKIDLMERSLSGDFAKVRAVKSRLEGNLHRYTLLAFMIMVVILGHVVVSLSMAALTAPLF